MAAVLAAGAGISGASAQYDIPISKSPTPTGVAATPRQQPKPVYKYELKPEHGPWLVVVRTFKGAGENDVRSRELAEGFADFIRERYKVPAYIHERGWQMRQDMLAEAREVIEAKRKYYISQGITPTAEMLKVKTVRSLPDEYAVFIAPARGVLKDRDTAMDFADQVRKLQAPKEFSDRFFDEKETTRARGGAKDEEAKFSNPFLSAFAGPNPTIAKTAVYQVPKADKFLMEINSREDYSLLHKTRKPYTILVKTYGAEGTIIPTGGTSASGESSGERLERAAAQASQVAEMLRKNKVEAFVFHTRYNSSVCIGQFDSPDGNDCKATIEQVKSMKLKDRGGNVLDTLMAKPAAMPIPRP
jgi:hypothetical protein